MNRKVIITVGKTHSGKSTLACELEKELLNSVIIDQDNHAEFLNTHYRPLLPIQGPNKIKHMVTKAIIDYSVQETDKDLILCNSNRSLKGRSELLQYFHDKGFESILVWFNLPDDILHERVSVSKRNKSVFRKITTYPELLNWQIAESQNGKNIDPKVGEADHLIIITEENQTQIVKQKIVDLMQ